MPTNDAAALEPLAQVDNAVFVLATRQMAPTLTALLNTLSQLSGSTRVAWIVDRQAHGLGWLAHVDALLTECGVPAQMIHHEHVDEDLTFAVAQRIIERQRATKRNVLCAQGGKKHDSLVLLSMLTASDPPVMFTYLDNRPARLLIGEIDAQGHAMHRVVMPDKRWRVVTPEQGALCVGLMPSHPPPSGQHGDDFEATVYKAVWEWRDHTEPGIRNAVHDLDRGLAVHEPAPSNRPVGQWDVYLVMRDGMLVALECKTVRNLLELVETKVKKPESEKESVKDLQSRLRVLAEVASSESKLVMCVRIADRHVAAADFADHWNKLDRHFAQVRGLQWVAFFEGSKAQAWAKANGRKSFFDWLTDLLRPYAA